MQKPGVLLKIIILIFIYLSVSCCKSEMFYSPICLLKYFIIPILLYIKYIYFLPLFIIYFTNFVFPEDKGYIFNQSIIKKNKFIVFFFKAVNRIQRGT